MYVKYGESIPVMKDHTVSNQFYSLKGDIFGTYKLGVDSAIVPDGDSRSFFSSLLGFS